MAEWTKNSLAEELVFNTEEADLPHYVLIRFDYVLFQNAKNSLIKTKFCTEDFGGHVVGLSNDVCVKRGNWPKHLRVAILFFRNRKSAVCWLDSNPEVKQQDWLGQVDIILVAAKNPPAPDQKLFVLNEMILEYENEPRFTEQEMADAHAQLGQHGVHRPIISHRRPYKRRGTWNAQYMLLHQFSEISTAESWAEERTPDSCKPYLLEVSTVLFELEPLCDGVL